MAPKHAQMQIFIQANITMGKNPKNLPRTIPFLVSGCIIKVFYKTKNLPEKTTFEWL